MEPGEGIFGALRWWGHRWIGSGVPVVFVGGESVEAAVMMWWCRCGALCRSPLVGGLRGGQ